MKQQQLIDIFDTESEMHDNFNNVIFYKYAPLKTNEVFVDERLGYNFLAPFDGIIYQITHNNTFLKYVFVGGKYHEI